MGPQIPYEVCWWSEHSSLPPKNLEGQLIREPIFSDYRSCSWHQKLEMVDIDNQISHICILIAPQALIYESWKDVD